jgi:hypothetical protein
MVAPAAAVCAVLVGSGAVRAWQAGKVGALLEAGNTPPSPLEELPSTFGELAPRQTEQEQRDVGNPCESLLEVLLPESERRLALAS